ncbi:MAG: hypothetical protein N2049_00150 [Anaerolineales bacterium]|nr:hypothetical protein [Anaerolineales bacterium]MCX7607618.1 hypothetical protein [Anaerolineales bacterium]MDW8226857.1 hypothetical protein [Anaerolineales bacterium]
MSDLDEEKVLAPSEEEQENGEENDNLIQFIAGRISYVSPEIGAFVKRLDDEDDDEIFVPIEVIQRQLKIGLLGRGSLVKLEKTRSGIRAIMPLD